MGDKTFPLPFEAALLDLQSRPDPYVDLVFGCLESDFMVMPRGPGFVDYAIFEDGYEALKLATGGFTGVSAERVMPVVLSKPISIVVLRSMLGFTPPEWAYVASQRSGVPIEQGAARTLDRKVRLAPYGTLAPKGAAAKRLHALVQTACALLAEGSPSVEPDRLHRLNKADTGSGLAGVRKMAEMGAPYAMLLYERFLGRPFAGHRDSVSEIVGDTLESAIESALHGRGVSFRKTKRAERVDGFDQAPDFIVPSEFNPQVVIEAKVTEDDGTARDKVTRVQHLHELSLARGAASLPVFQAVACIAGRGFGVRREDMRKLLLATEGKVFTLKTLDRLVECTRLCEFASKQR